MPDATRLCLVLAALLLTPRAILTFRPSLWPSIARHIGGVHELGPVCVIVHDAGLLVAWRQVVVLELRKPADA
jgi:hypothetical protein